MNNNPYSRNYISNYPVINQQSMFEQIDNQIAQLTAMKDQLKNNNQQHQQPSINQTFQFTPNGNGGIKYVNSIDEVNKESVFVDTPFFSKDLSVMWIKNANGEVKAYELDEIVKKDEKDLQIELLMAEVDELKGMIKNERVNSNVIKPEISEDTTTSDEPIREPVKESKSTSVSRVSKSKKE